MWQERQIIRRLISLPINQEKRSLSDRRSSEENFENSNEHAGYTKVRMHSNGNYKSFVPIISTCWSILGITVEILEGTPVEFWPDGTVKSCIPEKGVSFSINGVPAKSQEKTALEFYENGAIKSFTLSKNKGTFFKPNKGWIYRGYYFRPGQIISFLPNGDVESI